MVADVLASLSPDSSYARGINFSYVPLNHVAADGSGAFNCGASMDCVSTRFDSCLVGEYCLFGHCDGATQRQLANFLKCFEGPFANVEGGTNATRRKPCMAAAGLDFERVASCASNATMVGALQTAINRTRAPMYARLGPNPGLFPHIFVDGVHQANDTWTSLLRTLCGKLAVHAAGAQSAAPPAALPPACGLSNATLSWDFAPSALSAARILAHRDSFQSAVVAAVNLAASRVALPVHFEPDYVDVRAVGGALLLEPSAAEGAARGADGVHVAVRLSGVLGGYADALRRGGSASWLPEYMASALEAARVFGTVDSSSIANYRVVLG